VDTISDNEAKDIWNRVKRYINPENLKTGSREELAREIEKQMSFAGKSGKAGSMDTLVRNGFADRISEVEDVKNRYVEPVTPEGRKVQAREFKKEKPVSPNAKKVKFTDKRVVIKTAKRTRVFKPKNIRVTLGTYGGRSAFYVSNTRTKKRVSWGFVE